MSQMVSSYRIFPVKFCHPPPPTFLPSRSVGMSRQCVMQKSSLFKNAVITYRTQKSSEDFRHDNEKLPELRAIEAS